MCHNTYWPRLQDSNCCARGGKNPNIFKYFQENNEEYEAIKVGPSAIPVKSFVIYDCLPNTSPITIDKSCQDGYGKDKKFFKNTKVC